eukprot:3134578-Rhodomonas_salina.2
MSNDNFLRCLTTTLNMIPRLNLRRTKTNNSPATLSESQEEQDQERTITHRFSTRALCWSIPPRRRLARPKATRLWPGLEGEASARFV